MSNRSDNLNTGQRAIPRTAYTCCGIRDLLLVTGFCFFLVPFSIGGNSANYTFLLVPLGVLLTGRTHMPPRKLLLFMDFYVLIFALAVIYQYELIGELPRRAISFVLFMSVFSFMFMKVDNGMVRAFKRAIVFVGVAFSLLSVLNFFALGGSELGFDAKDAVGGQRYGFVYILAFWLLFLSRHETLLARVAKYAATFIVLSGLALSFSRASVVALIVSAAAYIMWSICQHAQFSRGQVFKRIFVLTLAVAAAVVLLKFFFPVIVDFFEVRLFGFLADAEKLQDNLANEETSEGTRIFIWKNILEYVFHNPLTGSGYLGVWILGLFEEMSGSAHNQYFDVLFRVGILGFLTYLVLLYKAGRFLANRHAGLFWGFVGVMVYGIFHETFKESHGGFVLAFLFGMMVQRSQANAFSQKLPYAQRATQGILRS